MVDPRGLYLMALSMTLVSASRSTSRSARTHTHSAILVVTRWLRLADAAHDCQRRAQLVRRVSGEATEPFERLLDGFERALREQVTCASRKHDDERNAKRKNGDVIEWRAGEKWSLTQTSGSC